MIKELHHKYIFLIFVLIITFLQNIYAQNLPVNSGSLKFWYRADDAIINSGSVSQLNDSSGNNYHLTQLVPGNQPVKIDSVLNGHSIIRFDGINDNLKTLFSQNLTGPLTLFIVVKNFSNSAVFIYDGGTSRLSMIYINGQLYIQSSAANFSYAKQAPFDFTYFSSEYNASQSGIFENGISQVTGSLPIVNMDGFTLGSLYSQDSYFFAGDVAEIVGYNSILTASERTLMEEYFNSKFAPPVQLPSDINISNSFCDTIISLINPLNNQYTNLEWSTGASTQTISVNKNGKYWVKGTNIFGKTSSDTIYVTYPIFNSVSNSTICAGNSLQWDTQIPLSSYTFQWQDNSTDSIFIISQTGHYYVKITDLFGCSITSDTAKIIVDNFASSISLGPDISLCAGNSITLTNGASPSLTYTWSTGSNNDSLIVNTNGQYSIVVTNTNNCVARDTINITIQGLAPVANFSAGIGCQNTAVSFTNLSSPPSGDSIIASNWNFGDPASGTFSTSTVNNPFHTFSDTGAYTVRLNVTTDAGCEQAITKTIHIAPNPTVNFSIGNSCQNDSTAFSNQSTSVAGYSITSLNWNFGDTISGTSNISTATNPKHVFGSQTTYTISLTATNNAGCASTLSNIIAVKPQVKADFTYSTPCTNTTTVFQDNSIASSTAANTRSWNFGGPSVSGLTVPRTYTATGPYNVSLTVSVNGCTSSINKIITIFSPPQVSFTIPAFCSKDTVTALNTSVAQSGIISSYNWRLNNNSFASVQNPTISLNSAGNYPVRLIVVNSFGCKDSLTKTLTVNPLPIVDFTTNPANYYYINEPIGFIPSVVNAASYYWNVSGVMTSSLQSPSMSINTEGTYTVSLNLQDQQGCKNSKTKTILISKRYLDLALLNVTTIKDDDGFMTVVADIANYGTVPAGTINLQYQISDGGNNKETWNGILNPNSFFTYTFNSKSASEANSTNNITCVTIKKVNGVDDENPNNNDLCSALYYDEISVSTPFPNPTAENITLPIILNKDIDYTMSIYNSTGQMLMEEMTQNGILGLNLVSIPTSSYAWGCYILKVVIDDKVFIKKFIKVNN